MDISESTRNRSFQIIQKTVGGRHKAILDILGTRQMTAHQIARELFKQGHTPRVDRNFAAPRLTELEERGFVAAVGKRKDHATGRNVAVWAKSDNPPKSESDIYNGEATAILYGKIALCYGYSDDEMWLPRLAVRLHDIGKNKLPSRLLAKQGDCSQSEKDTYKLHTAHGYNMLQSFQSQCRELGGEIAMYHHERHDGKGYWGLTKEKQSPSLRIAIIAAAYTDLTCDWVYGHKHTEAEAIKYIEEHTGTQFDPEIAECFFMVI